MTDDPARLEFGTDGLRGRAGDPPMDPATLRRIASAIGVMLQGRGGERLRVVAGNDGRESGDWILGALTQGFQAAEVAVVDVGLVTTPALACVARRHRFDAGIMISASHNAATDNGIKIFDREGRKLSEADEAEICALAAEVGPEVDARPRSHRRRELTDAYFDHLREAFPTLDLTGVTIAVDGANGGGSQLVPAALGSFGARVIATACTPDGTNINDGVGALHPEALAPVVTGSGAALGLCLDGDGDRGIFIDDAGNVRDGDDVLALLGPDWQRRGLLPNGVVVATEMSNMGLEVALRNAGIRLLRTKVGDKYVVEAMRRENHPLGGEQSGHIVFAGAGAHTGDGLFTALTLLSLPQVREGGFAAAWSTFVRFPQVLQNVEVMRKPPLDTLPGVVAARDAAAAALGDRGRVLLRYSGTENKCRVMVEGEDEAEVHRHVANLVDAVRTALAT